MLKAQRKSSCGEKLKGLKGWGEYVVKEKLEGLKRKLKDWSKNVSCVEKSHFFLEKELNDIFRCLLQQLIIKQIFYFFIYVNFY